MVDHDSRNRLGICRLRCDLGAQLYRSGLQLLHLAVVFRYLRDDVGWNIEAGYVGGFAARIYHAGNAVAVFTSDENGV